MNRREALQALVSLPAVPSIQRAELKPKDVIVIECPGHIAHATAEDIRNRGEAIWPGHRCVVLGDGLRMKIAREP